jgi:hypothetical protein
MPFHASERKVREIAEREDGRPQIESWRVRDQRDFRCAIAWLDGPQANAESAGNVSFHPCAHHCVPVLLWLRTVQPSSIAASGTLLGTLPSLMKEVRRTKSRHRPQTTLFRFHLAQDGCRLEVSGG